MVCPKCQKAVPDESTFCLNCGMRLVQAPRLVPVNGGGAATSAAAAVGEGVATTAPGATARLPEVGGKHAYALSFSAIADERLRYRVARWVCEHAPAHALSEVQEGLLRGDFLTFLALTPEEAEATRQGIQQLGLVAAALRLAPATAAQLLVPERRAAKASSGPRGMKAKDVVAVLATLAGLLLFGLVMMHLFGGRGF